MPATLRWYGEAGDCIQLVRTASVVTVRATDAFAHRDAVYVIEGPSPNHLAQGQRLVVCHASRYDEVRQLVGELRGTFTLGVKG